MHKITATLGKSTRPRPSSDYPWTHRGLLLLLSPSPPSVPLCVCAVEFLQQHQISALPTTFLCSASAPLSHSLSLFGLSVCLYLKCGKYLFATPEIRVAQGNVT